MIDLAPVTIVAISGSLRAGSVNSAVVATAAELAPPGAHTVVYRRLGELPHFNPDDDRDPLAEPVADLRARLACADAILFTTPEYAGSLPGSFKNLLDWTVGGSGVYGRPVGWINASAYAGAQDTYAALRIVLGRAGADIIEAACRDVPVPRDAVGEGGIIVDGAIRAVIAETMRVLTEAAIRRRSAAP